jgi:muconolactone delta-isomerase
MRFLVHNRMTRPIDTEIQALFPAEQARVAELFAAGSLEQLYVAADYVQTWLVARGESLDAARAAIESLPLARFVQSAYTPLAELA